MLGSGAMVVMAEGTNLLAAAVNVLRFFRDESCGKCVPCRVGSAKAHVILDDLVRRGGGPADVNGTVRELATVMRRTSICGLGQVALGPVASVLALAENELLPLTTLTVSSSPPGRWRRRWPAFALDAAPPSKRSR
jgi:formate dehydrogenase beta subunit